MFNHVPIKHKQMSFLSNGGKFKLYTVLNGLPFSFERILFFWTLNKMLVLRTPMQTESNSFWDALFRTHFFVRIFSDALF
jgi:hypothetical protein